MLAKMKAGTKKSVINAQTVDWAGRVVSVSTASEIVDKKIILTFGDQFARRYVLLT